MHSTTFYIGAQTPALSWATEYLKRNGLCVTEQPDSTVTHLLLSIPTPEILLTDLPDGVTVIGGNLDDTLLPGHPKIDLLKDEGYLAENAAITADCALRLAGSSLGIMFRGCPVLVIGWGRIGKCLAQQLGAMGANVTIAARKEKDRAIAAALGYGVTDIANPTLSHYRLLFNTVPAPVLSAEQLRHCRQDCVKIDLASRRGLEGDGILWARGLPGKMLPETTGRLIGRTILRLIGKEAVS